MMEPNVLTAHQEAVGWVTWILLAVLSQASLEVQDQAQQVQELKCKEEELKQWLAAAEHMLWGHCSRPDLGARQRNLGKCGW